MFQYRQVLVRLRAGDSEREIARARLMGREKLSALRAPAMAHGWLEPGSDLPDDTAIATAVGKARRARSTISSVEPHRARVQRWFYAGVQGKAIHAALCRKHGYTGSYSSVARLLAHLRAERPPEVTVRLAFDPGDAAQVDFGAGPKLLHPDGTPRPTWAFVMTLRVSPKTGPVGRRVFRQGRSGPVHSDTISGFASDVPAVMPRVQATVG